jgi:hypothetical protein
VPARAEGVAVEGLADRLRRAKSWPLSRGRREEAGRFATAGISEPRGSRAASAGLWWRVDGPSGVLAFDNMQDRGVKGTTDWTKFTIELPVDASVKNINFGALFPGDGTAWFDGLTIELDGKPISTRR